MTGSHLHIALDMHYFLVCGIVKVLLITRSMLRVLAITVDFIDYCLKC